MKNIMATLVSTLLSFVFRFVTRRVFLEVLGSSYLGISSLFLNTVSLLSLAEFGIGSAIIFNMYKPIAQSDRQKLRMLMRFYRSAYLLIGIAILLLGLCLMPCLPWIIRDDVSFVNMYLIFFIYLMQSASSYFFFAYKRALLTAHQKEYVATRIASVYIIVANMVQIAVLRLTGNYEIYILSAVLINVLQNITIAIKTDRLYANIIKGSEKNLSGHKWKAVMLLAGYLLLVVQLMKLALLTGLRECGIQTRSAIIKGTRRSVRLAIQLNNLNANAAKKTEEKLPSGERKGIIKNCYAIFLYRINGIVLNSTDNIILSAFIGLEIVGIYSNYFLIFTTLRSLLKYFMEAMTAGLGNLHASGDMEREILVFNTLNLFNAWLYGGVAVGVFVVADSVIRLWVGDTYVLVSASGYPVIAMLLGIQMYIYGILKLLATFRASMGLFRQGRYRPVAGMLINIAASLAFVQYWGIYGVLLGTIISNLTTYMWYDPIVILRRGFGIGAGRYFIVNLKYIAAIVASGAASYYLCGRIGGGTWFNIIVQTIICFGITSLVMYAISFNTKEFTYLLRQIKNIRIKRLVSK